MIYLVRLDDRLGIDPVRAAEDKMRINLEWRSLESGLEGKLETRRGVDVLHFKDGKIIKKLTYSKTTIEIEGKRVALSAKG